MKISVEDGYDTPIILRVCLLSMYSFTGCPKRKLTVIGRALTVNSGHYVEEFRVCLYHGCLRLIVLFFPKCPGKRLNYKIPCCHMGHSQPSFLFKKYIYVTLIRKSETEF